jgi:predicted RNA-binding protein YlxR (DUF448 family)
MQTNDLYSISVAKQRNRGSQIGSNKIRLQNWLEDNNLELFRVVEIGSNLNQKLYELQADTILRIAQHTNGYFLQEKKASAFGRNYYVGTSVQNVNKELRRAMLGNCYACSNQLQSIQRYKSLMFL